MRSEQLRRATVRAARSLTRLVGVDVVPFPRSHPLYGLVRYLTSLGVDLVLDVGANQGQYASDLRELGFEGRILSFEPVRESYESLEAAASSDSRWDVRRIALGAAPGTAQINVAANGGASSSLLPMLARHQDAAPEALYVRTESVEVQRLDDAVTGLSPSTRAFLKIDTQGFERVVLEGALSLLSGPVIGVQLELSLVHLYEGGPMYDEMLSFMADRGFRLTWLEPGFADPVSGEMLQFDAAFIRDPRRGGATSSGEDAV